MWEFMKEKKFTLVELLVVIAIIGILMTMLLPSLSKAREVAKRAVCIGNEKQLSIAVELYSSSNNMFYPAAATNGSPGSAYIGRISYDDLISSYRGVELTDAQKWENPLAPANEQSISDKVLVCPNDKLERTNGFTRSYSINAGTTWMYSSFLGVGNEQGYSISGSEIAEPNNLILMGERLVSANKRGGGSCAIMGNAMNHLGAGVHGKSDRAVFAFCDGHVSYILKSEAAAKQNR